jgi:hypothetical protein
MNILLSNLDLQLDSYSSFRLKPKFPNNRSLLSFQIKDLINHLIPQWKTFSIHALFDGPITQEILKIRISTDLEPNYIWTPSSSGLFSTSPAYRLINMQSSINDPLSPPNHFWKSSWKLNLNDRLKLFLWKIA